MLEKQGVHCVIWTEGQELRPGGSEDLEVVVFYCRMRGTVLWRAGRLYSGGYCVVAE